MPRPEADVLLAEDEPVVCRAVERILGSTGLTAEVTGTLVETLDRLRTTAFQILICDLMLPDGSGFEALAAARNRQPDLQTIVITGFATANNAVRSLARGAFDYLPKPFDPTELLGVVDRALHYRSRVVATSSPSPGLAPLERGAGSELLGLGRHSWARLEADGSAAVGPAETFFGAIEEPMKIELPEVGSQILQGRPLARLNCSTNLEHRVWSPLSGVALEVNEALGADPAPICEDPFGEGWIARILPSSQELEISRLWHRAPDSTVTRRPVDSN